MSMYYSPFKTISIMKFHYNQNIFILCTSYTRINLNDHCHNVPMSIMATLIISFIVT